MPSQHDMAVLVLHSGVRIPINRCDVIEKRIHDNGSVDDHHEMIFNCDDRFGIPFADGFQIASFCGIDAIN